MPIKFGTDGWRAIIAKEFTTDNVARVSLAVSDFLKKNNDNPTVVIGHDCRFAGELFTETAVKVLATKGVKVLKIAIKQQITIALPPNFLKKLCALSRCPLFNHFEFARR